MIGKLNLRFLSQAHELCRKARKESFFWYTKNIFLSLVKYGKKNIFFVNFFFFSTYISLFLCVFVWWDFSPCTSYIDFQIFTENVEFTVRNNTNNISRKNIRFCCCSWWHTQQQFINKNKLKNVRIESNFFCSFKWGKKLQQLFTLRAHK